MSEMTAAEAIELLNKQDTLELSRSGTHDYYWSIGEPNAKKISALIEQQAQEIAKKDRVIKKAIDKLFILPGRDECPDGADFCFPREVDKREPDIGDCRKCWLAWLEQQVKEGKI